MHALGARYAVLPDPAAGALPGPFPTCAARSSASSSRARCSARLSVRASHLDLPGGWGWARVGGRGGGDMAGNLKVYAVQRVLPAAKSQTTSPHLSASSSFSSSATRVMSRSQMASICSAAQKRGIADHPNCPAKPKSRVGMAALRRRPG